jgi:hypothetical protein
MRSMRSAIAVLMLLVLAGCATSPDPSKGGFISGVSGLMSGSYDQRVAEQSMELDRMRAQQVAAENQANLYRAALVGREQKLASLRSDVAGLDRSLKGLQAKAAQQRAGNVAFSDKDRQLMDDLAGANARLATLQEKLRSNTAADDYEATRQEYLGLRTAIVTLSKQLEEDQR